MLYPEFSPNSLDPGTTYKSGQLWLPTSKVNVAAIKEVCTLLSKDERTGTETEIRMYREHNSHIIIPREFFPGDKLPEPLVVLPHAGHKFEYNATAMELRENQLAAWEALKSAPNGILNLSCGRGKTFVALKKIAHERKNALIIIPNTGLMSQWRDEAVRWLNLKDDEIGIIQQDKNEWNRPFVLATLQTLARRAEAGLITPAMRLHPGIVVWDETHHLSSPMFSLTAPLYLGQRFGLSATPYRSDGLETIYMAHLGPIFFSDVSHEIHPRIFFYKIETDISMEDDRILDRAGQFNIGRFWKTLGQDVQRNITVMTHVKRAMDEGRRVLVLTHSKEHAELLNVAVPGSGLVDGSVPQNERQSILKKHQVIFATVQVAQEGLDAPMLDTVFFLTPFKEWNIVQQGIGRALRQYEGKKHPVAVIFWDYKIPPANAMCRAIMREMSYRDWKYQILP